MSTDPNEVFFVYARFVNCNFMIFNEILAYLKLIYKNGQMNTQKNISMLAIAMQKKNSQEIWI